jgi:hypothetical protein
MGQTFSLIMNLPISEYFNKCEEDEVYENLKIEEMEKGNLLIFLEKTNNLKSSFLFNSKNFSE